MPLNGDLSGKGNLDFSGQTMSGWIDSCGSAHAQINYLARNTAADRNAVHVHRGSARWCANRVRYGVFRKSLGKQIV